MIAFRVFTPEDWMGLAGAEPFEDGTSPLLADLLVDGFHAAAVIDRGGLTIMLEGVELRLEGANAPRAVALLRPEISTLELEQLGFTVDGTPGVLMDLVHEALEGNDR